MKNSFCFVCVLFRREAACVWDLWQDFLPVGQQERSHEEETRGGGAEQRRQGNRFAARTPPLHVSGDSANLAA